MGEITGQQIKDGSITGADVASASIPETDLILNFPTAELKANIISEAFSRKAHDVSVDENLGNLWVDDFADNTGISTSGANTTSAGYTYRGSANYDVIRDSAGGTETLKQNNITGSGEEGRPFRYNTANQYYMAEQFTTGSDEGLPVTKLSLKLDKVGSPSGNVWAEIWSDNGSDVPNALISNGATNTITCASIATGSPAWYDLTYTTKPTLSVNTKYWIVACGSYTVSTSDYINWQRFYPSSYAGGFMAYGSNVPVWDTAGYNASDCTFKVYQLVPYATATVYTITNVPSSSKSEALFVWEQVTGTGSITAYGSCDGGANWTEITSPTSFTSIAGTTYYKYVTGMTAGTDIRLKTVITGDSQLENWGIGY